MSSLKRNIFQKRPVIHIIPEIAELCVVLKCDLLSAINPICDGLLQFYAAVWCLAKFIPPARRSVSVVNECTFGQKNRGTRRLLKVVPNRDSVHGLNHIFETHFVIRSGLLRTLFRAIKRKDENELIYKNCLRKTEHTKWIVKMAMSSILYIICTNCYVILYRWFTLNSSYKCCSYIIYWLSETNVYDKSKDYLYIVWRSTTVIKT